MTTQTKPKRAKAKPADPRDAAKAAAEALSDAVRFDRAADAAAVNEARTAYVKGLLTGDAEAIGEAGEALAISPEQIAEDGALAEKLLKLQRRADARGEVAVKAREARAAAKAIEKQ